MANLALASGYALEPSVYRVVTVAASRISATKIADLESRIGYKFKSHERLIRALTHASATKKKTDEISHYERLEFLGDRVLGICVAEMLFFRFPKAREGELSVRLNGLVSGKTCTEIADEIELHDFIHAGSDAKHVASKRMQSVRADVVESLIASVYLDGGLDAAKKITTKYWSERVEHAEAGIRDSKTALQEWAHAQLGSTPTYTIASRSGPDHDPLFEVEVEVPGTKSAQGRGRSKRAAEQAAAQNVLLREAAWLQDEDGTIQENKI